MRVVFRKWSPQDKCFNYQNFPTHFRLTKLGQIYIPFKFAQSGCIPPKIKCEILAHKGSQTTRPTPGDYLAFWNRKPIGHGTSWRQWLRIKIFREKKPIADTFFISRSLSGALRRTTQWWAKLPKAKKNPGAEEQNNESTYSFPNCNSRQVLIFLYQG